MSRLTPFGLFFGKGLNDLIRGIRRYDDPDKRAEYLRTIVAECRDEVRSPDLDVKTTAILKLAYLEMLGYDMAWAGFHVTEVMASPHFQQKRIGYLAAMQSFRSDSELLMLVTNLVKMDLVSQNQSTVAVALSGLATFVTPLLASDISEDIMRMLSHSKSYIRKKAVLALHNVVLQYPEALAVAIQRMADLLEQAQQDLTDKGNVSVVGATVSVICELSTHAPSIREFLELTPKLYDVFTASQHNWTLIKLLKIFQLFTKREPRLKSRLLPPIHELLKSTEAVSLQYESINCILQGNLLDRDDFELAHDLVRYTTDMIDRNDPNLTLIATGIFERMAKLNPQFVPDKVVTDLLRVPHFDPLTRKNVMALLVATVNDDSFFDIVNELMEQLRAADSLEHRTDIAETISRMTAVRNYEHVPDFQWLISEVITEISDKVRPLELSRRLLDIVVRVKDDSVREVTSALCVRLLRQQQSEQEDRASTAEFLETCWWIVGEFPTDELLRAPEDFIDFVKSSGDKDVSPAVVTAVVKLVSKASASESSLDAAIELLTPYTFSEDYELQARSCQFLELLKLARSSPSQSHALLKNGLSPLFTAYELTPIAPGSQLRIRPPPELDLETPVEFPSLSGLDSGLDLEMSSDSETDSVSTRASTPAAAQESDGKSERETSPEQQLYNLTLLDTLRTSGDPKASRLIRPTKKKVAIATDETIGDPLEGPVSKPKKASIVFQSGFRGATNQLIEPDDMPMEAMPVKVKHKKKKKPKPVASTENKGELQSA